jgi:uncharacterized protein
MEMRPFGRTGEKFPILSFGAQHLADEEGCSEKQSAEIINYALDHGIRYFDTAHWYWDGESEERLGKVAKRRRKDMWIATKTLDRSRGGARKQLETSLKRLQTGHVDEWRMHYVATFEELDRITSKGGALEAAVKAQKEGLVRFISISNHGNPRVQVEALNRFPFASVLFPVSVMDHFVLSFVEELLPVTRAKGVAAVGMKVIAHGYLADMYKMALRYSFSLPIDTAIIGMKTMAELKADLAVAEKFKPLDDAEKLALFRKILPKVSPKNMPWKAEGWDNPVKWLKR